MRILKYKTSDWLHSIQWWLVTHQLAWKLTIALLVALAVIAGLWRSWGWVNTNSSALAFIATSATGVALAVFAWLTFRLSNRMVEYQYAPPMQLYSVSEPEVGEVTAGATQYQGLTWRICLLNVGLGPIWVENIDIDVSPALGRPVWTSSGRLCIFLDKSSNEINPRKPIIIDGHGDISIIIVLYDEKTKEHLQRIFGVQEKFIMRISVYQRRQLGRHDKSGWLQLVSREFMLPEKFRQNLRHTIAVPLREEPPRFHQP
jgi:hypothetical protein